jgi:hypothetical protein
MRTKFFTSLALTGLFLTLLSSNCKKEDDPPTGPATAELISRTWKLTAETLQIGTNTPADTYAPLPACEKDDLLVIRSNTTYEKNEGAAKCAPGDPQIKETGSWSLLQSDTKIKFTVSPTVSRTADIIEVTATTLKLRITQTLPGGNSTLLSTYTAQ